MELVDIYDENGLFLNKSVEKSAAKAQGLFHKAVHIWIINSSNEILIQKRNINKKIFPGLWDISVAGHVTAGESSLDTAIREIKEELGISIERSELEFTYTLRRTTKEHSSNIFFDTFLLNKDIKIEKIVLQKNEVDEVKWVSFDELTNLIETGKFASRENECKMLAYELNKRKLMN